VVGVTSEQAKKVLVVEDDSLVCLLLQDLLAELGCVAVGPANTAAKAETLAVGEPVDFALLDLTLGLGDSYRTAELLRERGVPFAFLTGHGSERIREDMRGEAALQKPIDFDELEQLLSRFGLLPPAS
jgi:DNA-binding response OmpR family regulator